MQVGFAPAGEALLSFHFGSDATAGTLPPATVRVACPRLHGPDMAETWHGPGLSMREVIEDEPDGDIRAAAARAYRRLLAQVRNSPQPCLLRIWNYLDAINADDDQGDAERYRRFCLGRAEAIDAPFRQTPPAATGIGHPQTCARVQLVALCSERPGIALENPRQVPAWRYPRTYGPVSPAFSRGMLYGQGAATRLLLSGTASIIGHRSLHPDDVAAQLHESLLNAAALLQQGQQHSGQRFAVQQPDALRVYLRRPQDLGATQDVIAAAGIAPERVLYLHGDICRRELLVELEAVFSPY